MKHLIGKLCTIAFALALACGIVAGCSLSGSTSANEQQQANRTYMSQVNEIMEQLDEGLESFVDAVSRGDVVNMRTQADDAFKVLDKLNELEAPEALADIQDQYKKGADTLRKALDAYIALYTDLGSDSFDWSTYDSRIAEIQAQYDEGASTLKAADEAAASMS